MAEKGLTYIAVGQEIKQGLAEDGLSQPFDSGGRLWRRAEPNDGGAKVPLTAWKSA